MNIKYVSILLFCLVLIFSSCDSMSPILSDTMDDTNNIFGDKTTMESMSIYNDPFVIYDGWNYWVTSQGIIDTGDNPCINFKEEYLNFYSFFKKQLPDDFISYEQLSDLGDFYHFIMVDASNHSISTLCDYTYGISDNSENQKFGFDIQVRHLEDGDSRDIDDFRPAFDPINLGVRHEAPEDMSISKHKETAITHEDSLYLYDQNGKLRWIKTIVDDYIICVVQARQDGEEYYFEDYVSNKPNFVTLLLSGADHEAVVASFQQMISTEIH